MKTPPIQEQIEALTQELRPYPNNSPFYFVDHDGEVKEYWNPDEDFEDVAWMRDYWNFSLFASTNKAEVEEYADCYHRLKLYQLLGKKAEKVFPLVWNADPFNRVWNYGTDFSVDDSEGQMKLHFRCCVFGGVWFAREEDRLEALKICGIDAEFQKRCAKYGLGGA